MTWPSQYAKPNTDVIARDMVIRRSRAIRVYQE